MSKSRARSAMHRRGQKSAYNRRSAIRGEPASCQFGSVAGFLPNWYRGCGNRL